MDLTQYPPVPDNKLHCKLEKWNCSCSSPTCWQETCDQIAAMRSQCKENEEKRKTLYKTKGLKVGVVGRCDKFGSCYLCLNDRTVIERKHLTAFNLYTLDSGPDQITTLGEYMNVFLPLSAYNHYVQTNTISEETRKAFDSYTKSKGGNVASKSYTIALVPCGSTQDEESAQDPLVDYMTKMSIVHDQLRDNGASQPMQGFGNLGMPAHTAQAQHSTHGSPQPMQGFGNLGMPAHTAQAQHSTNANPFARQDSCSHWNMPQYSSTRFPNYSTGANPFNTQSSYSPFEAPKQKPDNVFFSPYDASNASAAQYKHQAAQRYTPSTSTALTPYHPREKPETPVVEGNVSPIVEFPSSDDDSDTEQTKPPKNMFAPAPTKKPVFGREQKLKQGTSFTNINLNPGNQNTYFQPVSKPTVVFNIKDETTNPTPQFAWNQGAHQSAPDAPGFFGKDAFLSPFEKRVQKLTSPLVPPASYQAEVASSFTVGPLFASESAPRFAPTPIIVRPSSVVNTGAGKETTLSTAPAEPQSSFFNWKPPSVENRQYISKIKKKHH